MKHLPLTLAWLMLFGSALFSFAGAPIELIDAGDVFVATITRVEDEGATHSHPPRVWLKIHEVLRGENETNRSPAIWNPPSHDIDWGGPNEPELLRWNALPMKGPKVGEKFILGGRVHEEAEGEKKVTSYYLFAFVRRPYSPEARQKAIDDLKAMEAYHREYAAKKAAEEKERLRRATIWRAALDAETIDQMTQKADAVATASVVGYGDYVNFKVERMLKGRPRMSSSGTYYVDIPRKEIDERLLDIIYYRGHPYVLFLSEENLVASVVTAHLNLVDSYCGIVPADDAAIEAVEASLKKHPPPEPRPVLVISTLDYEDAWPLAKVAREHFEVVVSRQFSAHGERSFENVRDRIPSASCLLMIDSRPRRLVRAVCLDNEATTTIYEETWPTKETPEQVGTLLKTLVEQIKE